MQNTNYFSLCVCYILDAIADQHLWLHGYSWKLDVVSVVKILSIFHFLHIFSKMTIQTSLKNRNWFHNIWILEACHALQVYMLIHLNQCMSSVEFTSMSFNTAGNETKGVALVGRHGEFKYYLGYYLHC